jgi:molybdopterin molybdotransferase
MPTPWRQLAAELGAAITLVEGAGTISLRGAAGRVLAMPVVAKRPLPDIADRAVMDGFALGAKPPGRYRLVAEASALAPDEAIAVRAGYAVPLQTRRVVLARHARQDGETLVVDAIDGKDNIRRIGEECAAGDVILDAGTRLDARHLALAAITGVDSLVVRRRPRIVLTAVNDGASALPHLAVMAALLETATLTVTNAGVMRRETLATQIKRFAGHDLIVVVAESLGAEDDALAPLLTPLNGSSVIHRAAMKPAKPVLFGAIAGTPVLGLAGTAYAVTAAAHLFLRPVLATLAGLTVASNLQPAVAGFSRHREPGRAEALPVLATWQDGRLKLAPAGRFGQLKALAALDGFGLVAEDAGDITEGSPMEFLPLTMPLI